MKRISLLIFLISLNISCNSVEPDSSELIIRSGTSFGFCLGYCYNEINISDQEYVYKKFSRDSVMYPVINIAGELEENEFNDLVGQIDIDEIKKLNDVYGCPDCADGGAEWIEFISESFHKKITFEYGNTVQPIEDLIISLRELRKDFEEKIN